MEDTVDRAFELRWRQGLLRGNKVAVEDIPFFDLQDEKELEQKMEKIKQYYKNWEKYLEELNHG